MNRTDLAIPLAAGAAGTAAMVAGISTPSLWNDELATYSAITRSFGGLWQLAQNVDAHFLPYYAVMHVWAEFGDALWWLRLPAALAVGATAGLLADLGRRLGSRAAGIWAAAAFLLLPFASYHGQNARPYAFAALAAVLSCWALHRAVEGRGRRPWLTYTLTVLFLGCTHLMAVLVLPAHLLVAWRTGLLRRFLPAVAAGLVPWAGLAVLGVMQSEAVSWIERPEWTALTGLPSALTGSATLSLLLVGAAVAGSGAAPKPWLAGLWTWLLLPPLLLFAVSRVAMPLYVDRYFFAAAPALALLAGLALARVRPPAALALLLFGGVLALPELTLNRSPDGRRENYPLVVETIAREYRPGDVLIYGAAPQREGVLYYRRTPEGFPPDVLRRGTGNYPGTFGFVERGDLNHVLSQATRVWAVWRGNPALGVDDLGRAAPAKLKSLKVLGFEPVRTWEPDRSPGLVLVLFGRK
ncbi:glycosyltransferase family 39 protein [Herbidospora daliensis]|uniref:glycosyltransferase family 39 protein n=1 Tax=Herbidospora daliensis TaxID=295585 RepID=UPI00078082A8|nr:glycosyltransferase family 39 protein [Herbidospora daliensis]